MARGVPVTNDLHSYYTSLFSADNLAWLEFSTCAAARSTSRFHRLHVFCGGSEIGKVVQVVVAIVGVAGDEAMFGPTGDGVLVDIETRGASRFVSIPRSRSRS